MTNLLRPGSIQSPVLRELIDAVPSAPFAPTQISFDVGTGALGVFCETPPLPLSTATYASVARSLRSALPMPLDDLLASTYRGATTRHARFGCAVRPSGSNLYLEHVVLDRLLAEVGGEAVARFTPDRLEPLRPLTTRAIAEGVAIRILGHELGSMKIYVPVRTGDASAFHRVSTALADRDWIDRITLAIALFTGRRSIFSSGRLMLTLSSRDPRPGVAFSTDGFGHSAATCMVLLEVLRDALGLGATALPRLAAAFAWPPTGPANIAYVAVDAEMNAGPRVRVWVGARGVVSDLAPTAASRGGRDRGEDRAAAALDAAVQFLSTAQMPSGELPTAVSSEPEAPGSWRPDSCVFTTTFAIRALRLAAPKRAARTLEKAVDFLRDEMLPEGTWRFWTRRSGKRISPDADDTASVADALRSLAAPYSREQTIERLLANRNDAGLFFTWIHGTLDEPNGVDAVVNANVIVFLEDHPEAAHACAYLVDLVRCDGVGDSSHYYQGPRFLNYALARACARGVRGLEGAREHLVRSSLDLSETAISSGDALDVGLALGTLAYLECGHNRRRPLIRRLLEMQSASGSWRAVPAWCGPPPPAPASQWWGSQALTTAICLEALALTVV